MQQIKIVEMPGNNHIDSVVTNHFHPRFLDRFGPGWHNYSRYGSYGTQSSRIYTTLEVSVVTYEFRHSARIAKQIQMH